MSIYVENNKKVSDIFVNVGGEKKKVVSAWADKSGVPAKIFSSKHESIWSSGSWSDISDLLNKHYAGEINIENYFNLGEERVVPISAIPTWNSTYGETQPAQNITLIIIGFNLDQLRDSVNGKTNAAITVHLKQCLSNTGVIDADYIVYESNYNTLDLEWVACDRRVWCNQQFKNSLPIELQNLIKIVGKTNRRVKIYGSPSREEWSISIDNTSSPTICYDQCFLLNRYELGYIGNTISDKDIVYPYYQNKENALKKERWWLRDPSYNGNSEYGSIVNGIGWQDQNGRFAGAQFLRNKAGIAPAFCL